MIKIKCYKNLTYNTNIIFDRVCLTNTTIKALRIIVKETFKKDMPGSYITIFIVLNIFILP